MTTETERRVPEHPGWQPWWIRYAKHAGSTVILSDRRKEPGAHRKHCFTVISGPMVHDGSRCSCCGASYEIDGDLGGWFEEFDSLADAEAAFELACERLREGG